MPINRGEIVTAAIVGAGQIGSRHLQALAKSERIGRVEVLGRSAASLAVAEQRWREAAPRIPARFTRSLSELSGEIDVAIFATNSDTRLEALRALLASRKIGAVILEKVVFASAAEFDAASAALHGVPAWVNCFRRAVPYYQALRAQLRGEWALRVEGGEWGLGCNAVHYVDLCAFLAGSEDVRIDQDSALDAAILQSKRPGFVEFTGRIRGSCGGRRFELIAHAGSNEAATVRIDGRALDEAKLPLQSKLTHLLVEEILATGRSSLPTLAQARAVHVPLLELFSEHLARVTGERPARCPVT